MNEFYAVKGAESGEPLFSIRGALVETADLEVTIHYRDFPDDAILIKGRLYPLEEFFDVSPISGTHSNAPDGVIIMRGPGVDREAGINCKNVILGEAVQKSNIMDIAPTMLYLMGLPVGADMDGRVLVNAFTRDYLKKHPITTIPSYQTLIEMAAGGTVKSGADDRIKDQLRNLGYIN